MLFTGLAAEGGGEMVATIDPDRRSPRGRPRRVRAGRRCLDSDAVAHEYRCGAGESAIFLSRRKSPPTVGQHNDETLGRHCAVTASSANRRRTPDRPRGERHVE
jgi:hypothetical protein